MRQVKKIWCDIITVEINQVCLSCGHIILIGLLIVNCQGILLVVRNYMGTIKPHSYAVYLEKIQGNHPRTQPHTVKAKIISK